MDLAAVPWDFKGESLQMDAGFCDRVVFEVQVSKTAAISFPEERREGMPGY